MEIDRDGARARETEIVRKGEGERKRGQVRSTHGDHYLIVVARDCNLTITDNLQSFVVNFPVIT